MKKAAKAGARAFWRVIHFSIGVGLVYGFFSGALPLSLPFVGGAVAVYVFFGIFVK